MAITQNDMELLQKIFNNQNSDNLQNANTFLKMGRKQFAETLKAEVKMKPATAVKLYKIILNRLQLEALKAETKQFGIFLSEFNDKHWHHILRWHINDGTKTTIKNTLRFYSKMIHFEDEPSQIQQCLSVIRKQRRTNRINSTQNFEKKENENRINSINKTENKNLWSLNQYYMQSELDNIHSYLA
eukprot:85992_1